MMNAKRMLVVLIAIVILGRWLSVINQAPDQLTDRESLRRVWLHSQYNLSRGYEFYGNMSDEDVRTYASLELIQGRDPASVNFEDPPLVKYLFGLSHLVFGDILLIQFLMSFLVLLLTFLLGRRLGLPPVLTLIPPLVLVFDPLFTESMINVNLDLPQTVLVLWALVLLTRRRFDRMSLGLLGLSVGSSMASKVVFTGLLLLFFAMGVLILKKMARRGVVFVAIIALAVYLVSYSAFFVYHRPTQFLSLHLQIVRLYRSYLPEYPWFEIWRILLLGKWRTWFADPAIQPVREFWIAWPVSTLVAFALLLKKEIRGLPLKTVQILLGWSLVYLAFQSTHVVFPRYLLSALPPLYILATYHLNMSLPQLWFDFAHHPEPAEGKLGASSQSSEAKPRTESPKCHSSPD